MQNPRVQTLIETIQFTQSLAVYYISLLKEVDPTIVFKSEDKELDSRYWWVGHLAWAENMLVLKGTSGAVSDLAWLDKFQFGAAHQIDTSLSFDALKLGAKQIHQAAIEHLQTLSDADLDKPNTLNFGFGQEPTNQIVLMHFIRHLGTHIGHLGWLCKLYGVKAV